MITLFGGFFSCLLWGLAAAALFGGLLWLLRAFMDLRYSVASAVIAALCTIGVFWESIQIAGGLHVRSYVAEVSDYADRIAGASEGGDISMEALAERLPDGLDGIADVAETFGADLSGNALEFIDDMKDEISSYLLARVAWLLGIVIVGSVAFVLLCERGISSMDIADMSDTDIY